MGADKKQQNYLHDKIQPFDPKQVTNLEEALVALQRCSFQGRNLGKALEVLSNMVKEKDCLKVLTLSGALIPAGMEEIINQAIERKIIDVIVTTGANIIHSIVNTYDSQDAQAHYIGSTQVDDNSLYDNRINRIYDTFLPETNYAIAEEELVKILLEFYPQNENVIVTPSELMKILGPKLKGRSFLSVAAKNNVPIFCGASSDSELGLNLVKYRESDNLTIILDELGDVINFGKVVQAHKKWGTLILGGGVPRNWAQQIFPYLDMKNPGTKGGTDIKYEGYHYSVRFHSAVEHDGGLSGCTISESVSWGKYASHAKHQSVWGDATVYFPLIITALFQRLEKANK